MNLGRPAWKEARETLTRLLSAQEGVLRDDKALQQKVLVRHQTSKRNDTFT